MRAMLELGAVDDRGRSLIPPDVRRSGFTTVSGPARGMARGATISPPREAELDCGSVAGDLSLM